MKPSMRAELRDDDVVVEHIHEDAKTEEKENENGEKEIVEVSPAKDTVKINKRPVSLSDIHPLWTKHPNECTDEEYKEFYRKVFYGLQGASVLDPSEHGLSVQSERVSSTSRRSTQSMILSKVRSSFTTIRSLSPIISKK